MFQILMSYNYLMYFFYESGTSVWDEEGANIFWTSFEIWGGGKLEFKKYGLLWFFIYDIIL